MELQSLVQTLQGELRAIATLRKQEAEHTMTIVGLVGKLAYEASHHSTDALHPAFPENDYGNVVQQIKTNPNLIKKRKWLSESWPRYAIRLSKWVGRAVDAQALRAAFDLQN